MTLAELFDEADATGSVHALDLATGAEIGHRADELVVPASVFKVPVLLELFAGEHDVSTPVPVETRSPGPYGISIMRDPMTMSLRDLAWLMIGISDNAATDVICDAIGLDNVNARLKAMGLAKTRVDGHCADLFRTITDELGVAALDDVDWNAPEIAKLSCLDPERSLQATTPRETTRLLQLIWEDPTCEEVRRILGLQVWPHRLASGFNDDDGIRTSGKTGTLASVRNEVGVVEYPDGRRYAVAVFVSSSSLATKQPVIDALIGRAARTTVDALRR